MEPTPRRGLIDTLAAGFGTLHRQILIILIPISVDLLLWIGPKVSLGRFLGPAPEAGAEAGDILVVLGEYNILGLLAFQIPTAIGFTVVETVPAPTGGSLQSWLLAAPLIAVLAGLGVLVACIYLGVIASLVRGETLTQETVAVRTFVYWVRFTGLLLLVAGGVALLTPVAAVLNGLLNQISPVLALSLVIIPFFLATFYLFFVEDALFVSQVGPISALRYGALVVRRFFRQALSLFLLIYLIILGMAVLWSSIASHPVGLLAAIVGNAYVATGLTAAGMVFYKDRVLLLQQDTPAG